MDRTKDGRKERQQLLYKSSLERMLEKVQMN